MNDKFWGNPMAVIAEPFARTFREDVSASKQGASYAGQRNIDRNNDTRSIRYRAKVFRHLRESAGACVVDLIDQRFTGKARETAHSDDKLRRLAQLPKAPLTITA